MLFTEFILSAYELISDQMQAYYKLTLRLRAL